MESSSVPAARSEPTEFALDFGRIVTFTDGVFVIAITLLVLGLDIPRGVTDLTAALLDEREALVAYALSFAVIPRLWLSHRAFCVGLRRFDGPLVTINFVYLAWIALVPFTSQVLGDYNGHWQAAVVYAVCIAGVTLTSGAAVSYAYRKDLLHSWFRDRARTESGPGSFAAALCFIVSIPVAFIHPALAVVVWIATAFVPDRAGEILARPAMGPRETP